MTPVQRARSSSRGARRSSAGSIASCRTGRPFSVLTIEVDDLDRLLASATGREVVEAIEAAERAICNELRPADMLVRERLGRYWLTAPETTWRPAARSASGWRTPSRRPPSTTAPRWRCRSASRSRPTDAIDADMLAAPRRRGPVRARAAGVRLA